MKEHINIPIFIPHLGCPNSCVFCNQRTISGVKSFDISEVKDIIDGSIKSSVGKEREIAFFGGSFTGIDRGLMISLLEIAYGYVKSGEVVGLRCSTRPDYINREVLDVLKQYGMRTIELGIQSISESVLRASKRGHSASAAEQACRLVVENGFDLVGQMMIGLPNSTLSNELETAEFIIKSGAKAARVYPTVVFRNTELCDMSQNGEYVPLTVEEAVYRSAEVCKLFINNGVKIIRIGLCSSESVLDADNFYAGPMHPALGELVENEIFYSAIKKEIISLGLNADGLYDVFIPRGTTSKAIGQRRKNKSRLVEEFQIKDLRFIEDDSIKSLDEIRVEERKITTCI